MRSADGLAISIAIACFVVSTAGVAAPVEKSTITSSDTTKAEKKRVRKELPPRLTNDKKAEAADEADEEEGGFFASCLGDILGSFLGSICGGSSTESDEARAAVEGEDLAGGVSPQIAPAEIAARTKEAWRWYVRGEASVATFEGSAIREEYESHIWEAGIETGVFLTRSMHVDLLFGYLAADGTPQYKYESGASMDWPLTSDLQIMNFGAQGGQLFTNGERSFYFKYAIGPSVFNVKESASIAVYEEMVRTGTRTDELSKWKFGGEASIDAGWLAARRIPIGAYIRFSWIPWKSDKDKSLTLDYLDSNNIFIYNMGITVGYLFF